MSIELSKLIDKEDILVDSKKLSEWSRQAGKFELFKKIDKVRDDFVENNVDEYNWEVMALVCKFAEKVKEII